MEDVTAAWKQIRAWYKLNAPSESVEFPKGASKKGIQALESVLGFKLPADVIASYLLHDGSAGCGIFPYGYYLNSLNEIEREWTIWRDLVESGGFAGMHPAPSKQIKPAWWNVKWIPITSNGGGDHDCVDTDPAGRGHVGQIIEFSHETGARKVAAVSLVAWLTEFADALKDNKYRYDEDSFTLLPVDSD